MPARPRRSDRRQRSTASGLGTARRPLLAAGTGLVLITLLTFAPIRDFEFVNYDDGEFVTGNARVASGLSFENVRWAFMHPYVATGGPITWVSHMLDVEIAGLDPGAHHVTNLLFHLANTLLLLVLFFRMTGSRWTSAFLAALFAVHPLHVESVAWVSQRKDVLSTFFLLLTMLAYVSYVRRPARWRYAAVIVLAALGLMSKPMLVTLPVVLLLLDFWPLGRIAHGAGWLRALGTLAFEKLPLFVLAAVTALITIVDQRSIGAIAEQLPLLDRLSNASVSYLAYLWKMVWPADLTPFYPYRDAIPAWMAAGSALVLAAMTGAAVRAGRSLPYVTVGWVWYVITLLPASGLIQAGGHAMADRFTYVPLIGIFIIVAWGARDIAARARALHPAVPVAAALAVAACAIAARAQTLHWRNSVALWQHAVDVTPDSARPHANLGVALAAAGGVDAAVIHYTRAIALDPRIAEAHNNLALAFEQRGRFDDALAHYREAVRLKPQYARAHNNLGTILHRLGRSAEGLRHYQEAVRLDPGYLRARVNLAVSLAEAGRLDDALPHMFEVLRADPGDPQWHFLSGAMLLRQGDRARAIPYLETAVRLDPSHEAARQTLQEAKK